MLDTLCERIKAMSRVIAIVISLFLVIIVCKLYLSAVAYPKTSGITGLLSKKSIDYLFIGSSLTRQSYDMELIEREYKLNAYAVTYNSLSPAMAYKILKYVLNNTNIRLNTVIMEAYPYKLSYSLTAIEDVRLFNSAPVKIKFEIIDDMYSLDRDMIKLYDLIVLADNEYLFNSLLTYKIVEKLSYNGGYRYKKVAGINKFNRNRELQETANINQRQCQSYNDLINICAQHNIKIIFIEPFVPNYIQNGKNYTFSKELVKRAIVNTGNKFYDNNTSLLNNNDPSLFGDDIHLSTKGRELWTREIMRFICKSD